MGCTNSSNVGGPDHIGTSRVCGDIYKYTIDEHEYIRMGYGLAHSGTCKKCRQEKDSINVILNAIKDEWSNNK